MACNLCTSQTTFGFLHPLCTVWAERTNNPHGLDGSLLTAYKGTSSSRAQRTLCGIEVVVAGRVMQLHCGVSRDASLTPHHTHTHKHISPGGIPTPMTLCTMENMFLHLKPTYIYMSGCIFHGNSTYHIYLRTYIHMYITLVTLHT